MCLCLVVIPLASSDIIGVGTIIDDTKCTDDLNDSDSNKDTFVDQTEYLKFVQLHSNDHFTKQNSPSYSELPIVLQSNFNIHGVCMDGSESCDASSKGLKTYTETEDDWGKFFAFCEDTHKKLEIAMLIPIKKPTLKFPVATPTSPPTRVPTTLNIVLKPTYTEPSTTIPSPTGLNMATVMGIAAVAFLAGFLAIAGLYSHGQTRDKTALESSPSKPHVLGRQPLGAVPANYGPQMKKVGPLGFASLEDDCASDSGSSRNNSGSVNDIESQASSSNAGSSGWSSSAGMSSYNTGSVDSGEDRRMGVGYGGAGSSLAQIGVQSGATSRLTSLENGVGRRNNPNLIQFMPIQRKHEKRRQSDSLSDASDLLIGGEGIYESDCSPDIITSLPRVSRLDLNNAIDSGDWAAVGATAALLASAADSISTKSFSTYSQNTPRSNRSNTSSKLSGLDSVRAAELDHLVDAGDWEGVVLAAAKFEGNSSKGTPDDLDHFEDANSDNVNSAPMVGGLSSTLSAGSATRSSNGSASSAYSRGETGSGVSASPSTQRKRDEIRSEVDALVRRVVPDEIDNVDEMMLQFRGREEELIETLRTMQERSIAQRARAAMHKNAKREARKARARRDNFVDGPGSTGSAGRRGFPPRPPSNRHNFVRQVSQGSSGHTQSPLPLHLGSSSSPPTQDKKDPQSNPEPLQETIQDEIITHAAPVNSPSSSSDTTTGTASGDGTTTTSSTSNSQSNEFIDPDVQHEKSPPHSPISSQLQCIQSHNLLDEAIEAGDWEAVGNAAIILAENSANSVASSSLGSSSLRFYDTASYPSCYEGSQHDSYRSCLNMNAERAAELDGLIDRGDWMGVVALSGRFSIVDKQSSATNLKEEPTEGKQKQSRSPSKAQQILKFPTLGLPPGATNNNDNTSTSSPLQDISNTSKSKTEEQNSVGSATASLERNKEKALQEEEDALAQAEIWMAIAAQSIPEKSAAAATEAANWAISRSLVALNAGVTEKHTAIRGRTRQEDEKLTDGRHKGSVSSACDSRGETSV